MAHTKMFPPRPIKLIVLFALVNLQIISISVSQSTNKDVSNSNNNNKQAVDDILKDTMLLLDALDQKLSSVQNKTPNALMRDNLRALESSSPLDLEDNPQAADNLDWLSHVNAGSEDMLSAASSNINEHSDLVDSSSLASSSSLTTNSSTNSNSIKQARQLKDENLLASDSTERHIKFSLDLMQAVFASHSNQLSRSSSKATAANSIESFLISPLSIQMVLMMMHLGARGQTKRELGNCLHLPATDIKPPQPATPDSSSGSNNKLKRRNQAPEKPPKQTQRQPANGSIGPHEVFGAAVRNLLKDPSVLKALTSANQVFLQKDLQLAQQFEWAIKNHYATDIKLVDFQQQSANSNSTTDTDSAANSNNTSLSQPSSSNNSNNSVQQIINDWIERQSRGKISNFLTSPVPVSTLLMAINVIYFKGDWQYKFDPADTETDAWFTQANGKQVKIPMMVNRLPLAYAHDASMRTSVVELPYKAQRLGLFLMLPDEVSGIFHTMQMLNSTSFAHLISSMRKPSSNIDHQQQQQQQQQQASASGINIRIPKFSIESSPRLSQILSQQLGLKTLFTPDTADLTGMFAAPTQSKRLTNKTLSDAEQPALPQVGLDELIHKAVLQVDEQGSVAAATSATIVERVGTFSGNYFEADHPFLLFLMDKQTGLVLFSGVFAGNNQQQDQQQEAAAAASCKKHQQCNNP